MGQATSNDAEKIYLHYEENENQMTLKLSFTESDVLFSNESYTIDQLRDYFMDNATAATASSDEKSNENKRSLQHLDKHKYHLERKNADTGEFETLRGDELVCEVCQSRDDVYLKSGPTMYKGSKDDISKGKKETLGKQLTKCRNFGCKDKRFNEEDNSDLACHFHSAPPTFHDTKKGWSCCSGRMVYDWSDFENIPTCQVGRHSEIDPKNRSDPLAKKVEQITDKVDAMVTDSASNNTLSTGQKLPAAPAVVLKSIDDFNQANPNAATAVSSVLKDSKKKKTKVARTDGKARCKNFGCQKEYVVDTNSEESCSHHVGPPVFHDSGKFWSCCPKKVKYDFDEFLKVPGCSVSAHRDTPPSK